MTVANQESRDITAAAMPACARCQQLEAELAAARSARDEALTALALATEQLEALRLSGWESSRPAEAIPGEPPPPPPLRYRVADALNGGLKRWARPLHLVGRAVVSRVGREGRS